MTRQEYINYCMDRKSLRQSKNNVVMSVADPTMAQTGRDLVFNPKPIRYNRCTYAHGVPTDQMQPFDKMYADRLDVFSTAQSVSNDMRDKLNKIEKQSQTQPPKTDQ